MKKLIILLLVLAVAISGCSSLSGVNDALSSLSQAVDEGALDSIMDEVNSAAGSLAQEAGSALESYGSSLSEAAAQGSSAESAAESSSESSAPPASESQAAQGNYSGYDNPDGTPISTGELTAVSMIAEYPASVTIEKTEFASGSEPIKVTFTAGDWVVNSNAWIGIVPAGTDHGDESIADELDIDYFYPSEYSDGYCEFTLAYDPGEYDLRFYVNDDGGIELLYIPFVVV